MKLEIARNETLVGVLLSRFHQCKGAFCACVHKEQSQDITATKEEHLKLMSDIAELTRLITDKSREIDPINEKLNCL